MNTKINVQLLLKVADQISKTPEQFDMRFWDCGAVACIAGWTLRLSKVRVLKNCEIEVVDKAMSRLGISCQADAGTLFLEPKWPAQFRFSTWDNATDQASKAVKRIHAFLDEHAPGWRDEPTNFQR